jgi:hypothetical protein
VPQSDPLESQVARELNRSGLEYRRDVGLAGSRVDFVVLGSWGGPVAALEVRQPSPGQAVDRLRIDLLLARTYAEFLRGIKVLVVTTDSLAALYLDNDAIVPVSGLVDRLRPLLQARSASAQAAALIQPDSTPTVFVSMPLAEKYVDTFARAIRPAAKAAGLVAVQLGHDPASGDIVSRIKDEIRAATFVLADLSESRPSVLHEYGFAEAVPRPVVAITSTGAAKLPFNVRNNTTHDYVRGNTAPLKRYLLKAFRKECRRFSKIPRLDQRNSPG